MTLFEEDFYIQTVAYGHLGSEEDLQKILLVVKICVSESFVAPTN